MNSVIKELRIMVYMMVVIVVMYALADVMYYHMACPVLSTQADTPMALILYVLALFGHVIVIIALIDCRRKERAYYNNCRIMKSDVKGGAYYW